MRSFRWCSAVFVVGLLGLSIAASAAPSLARSQLVRERQQRVATVLQQIQQRFKKPPRETYTYLLAPNAKVFADPAGSPTIFVSSPSDNIAPTLNSSIGAALALTPSAGR